MNNAIYKGEAHSFIDLLKRSKIEVPIIQRDYAQGREDKKEIRVNFLNALHESISEETKIMLDFIYGSRVEECFQPLDGQQRLTTLFLLHIYAAKKENVLDFEVLKKFTYETRISSREFCLALVENEILISSNGVISEEITDSPWFFLSWKNDPTIRSMLTTLDDIHNLFFSMDSLWDKLTSETNGLVGFYCVDLENIGLTDDLYIKMNARGKLLTPFENFKASFQKLINENKWENGNSFDKSFANKIDTDWTDFYWEKFKRNNRIDDSFTRFISAILMLRLSVERDSRMPDRLEVIRLLHEDHNNVKSKFFLKNDFNYLVNCFNLYCEKYDEMRDINLDLPFWRHTPDNDFLNTIVSGSGVASYTQKVLFFAQTEYFRLVNNVNPNLYLDWMRVVRNIVSRGDVEKGGKRPDLVRSPQTFDGVVNLISELSSGCADIYSHLNSLTSLRSTFAKDQIEEERKKARLINENPDRKTIISALEDTELLRGKIDFIFYCMGSSSSFDDELLSKLQILTSSYFKNESDQLNDLRRALLTVEVEGKHEFYSYWWSSWGVIKSDKRCLLENFREIEYYIHSEHREYFKNLLLKLIEGKTLRQIADEFTPPDDFPNWKIRLIREKELLDDKCKSNYIAIPDDNSCCYLLKSKRPRDADGCIEIK